MNNLQGHITNIEVSGSMSIVSVSITDAILLKAIVIETPETANYLQLGKKISMLFKETEVIIGTGENIAISLQNKIHGTIKHIEKGTLLSKVVMDTPAGDIQSIISSNAVAQLGLVAELKVIAMIKLNEVMLSAI